MTASIHVELCSCYAKLLDAERLFGFTVHRGDVFL